MATTRSARGVMVDFDLLKIKEQMAATPKATPVRERENFIDQRFKRRLNRAKVAAEAAAIDAVEEASSEAEVSASVDESVTQSTPTTKPRINKDK